MKKINSMVLALLIVMSAFAGAIASVSAVPSLSAVQTTAAQTASGSSTATPEENLTPTLISAEEDVEEDTEDDEEEASTSAVTIEEAIASVSAVSSATEAQTEAEEETTATEDEEEQTPDLTSIKKNSDEALRKAIRDRIQDIEKQKKYEEEPDKRSGFVKIWIGQGWIEHMRKDEGYLITGFWLNYGVLGEDFEDANIKSLGNLWVGTKGLYTLVRMNSDDDSVNFLIIPSHIAIHGVEDLEIFSVGTLKLTKTKEYDELTLWSGKMVFLLGDLQGRWDVEIGTNTRLIKIKGLGEGKQDVPVTEGMTEEVTEESSTEVVPPGQAQQKGNIWRRFLFWLRGA